MALTATTEIPPPVLLSFAIFPQPAPGHGRPLQMEPPIPFPGRNRLARLLQINPITVDALLHDASTFLALLESSPCSSTGTLPRPDGAGGGRRGPYVLTRSDLAWLLYSGIRSPASRAGRSAGGILASLAARGAWGPPPRRGPIVTSSFGATVPSASTSTRPLPSLPRFTARTFVVHFRALGVGPNEDDAGGDHGGGNAGSRSGSGSWAGGGGGLFLSRTSPTLPSMSWSRKRQRWRNRVRASDSSLRWSHLLELSSAQITGLSLGCRLVAQGAVRLLDSDRDQDQDQDRDEATESMLTEVTSLVVCLVQIRMCPDIRRGVATQAAVCGVAHAAHAALMHVLDHLPVRHVPRVAHAVGETLMSVNEGMMRSACRGDRDRDRETATGRRGKGRVVWPVVYFLQQLVLQPGLGVHANASGRDLRAHHHRRSDDLVALEGVDQLERGEGREGSSPGRIRTPTSRVIFAALLAGGAFHTTIGRGSENGAGWVLGAYRDGGSTGPGGSSGRPGGPTPPLPASQGGSLPHSQATDTQVARWATAWWSSDGSPSWRRTMALALIELLPASPSDVRRRVKAATERRSSSAARRGRMEGYGREIDDRDLDDEEEEVKDGIDVAGPGPSSSRDMGGGGRGDADDGLDWWQVAGALQCLEIALRALSVLADISETETVKGIHPYEKGNGGGDLGEEDERWMKMTDEDDDRPWRRFMVWLDRAVGSGTASFRLQQHKQSQIYLWRIMNEIRSDIRERGGEQDHLGDSDHPSQPSQQLLP